MRDHHTNLVARRQEMTLETLATGGFAAPALLDLRLREERYRYSSPCQQFCATSPWLTALRQCPAFLAGLVNRLLGKPDMMTEVDDDAALGIQTRFQSVQS